MFKFIKYNFFLFFVLVNSSFASLTAIEMGEDDIILLKNLSARSYSDAAHNHGAVRRGDQLEQETIDEIEWTKRPFYTATQAPSSIGTIYYSNNPQVLVVAFHGSYWLKDWIDDFKAIPRPASDLAPSLSGRVHTGFSSLVADSYADMMAKIRISLGRDIQNNDEIYFTGHSLGGALAMLGGTMISFRNNFQKNSIKIITFSSPRGVIGDPEFVQRASKKLSSENILSFSTKGDVVPYLPQKLVSCLYTYEPLGVNIEISPMEKAVSHYYKALPRGLDEAVEHPLRPIGWGALGYLAGFEVAVPTLVGTEYFKTSHALPSDEVIKRAFKYTVSNYRNTSMSFEEIGEFSLVGSIQRNFLLKSLYNIFS